MGARRLHLQHVNPGRRLARFASPKFAVPEHMNHSLGALSRPAPRISDQDLEGREPRNNAATLQGSIADQHP